LWGRFFLLFFCRWHLSGVFVAAAGRSVSAQAEAADQIPKQQIKPLSHLRERGWGEGRPKSDFPTASDVSEARNSRPQTEHPALPAPQPGHAITNQIEPSSPTNRWSQISLETYPKHALIHMALWIVPSRLCRRVIAVTACGLLRNAPRGNRSVRSKRS